jgi:signal transduction histidine kinase
LILTGVLISSVRRKARSNKLLQDLNYEISLQKEHVDRVNHNLEEIIEERTRDLKIKNHKLSEYSSHLSHQIRGPVATLKGLMLLEKDKLIDQNELVQEINKCVGDIDDKIININKSLNDASVPGFKAEV